MHVRVLKRERGGEGKEGARHEKGRQGGREARRDAPRHPELHIHVGHIHVPVAFVETPHAVVRPTYVHQRLAQNQYRTHRETDAYFTHSTRDEPEGVRPKVMSAWSDSSL